MKKTINRIVTILSCLFIITVILIIFFEVKKPGYYQIAHQMEKYYDKDFKIIEKLTYTTYTQGSPEAREEIECPAVILQDKDNENIKFLAYAYPLVGGDWGYHDNYGRNLLIYCLSTQQFEFENKEECQKIDTFHIPCLILDNTEETAIKLQNTVVMFNEFYCFDDTNETITTNTRFAVKGTTSLYSVMGNKTKDKWKNQTSPFCYNTPIKKYKKFLNEVIE
ncbi:MAG: hypothetical protein E7259_07160 [Lachnospiraceae bacterium]|nr:hypothetical protein [Lachnospiraceae bacterium]